MRLTFLNLKLKNFLSYSEAEINLEDQGYCLIKGQNNFSADNASSNGSGKSSWISAICWALTGETIQGIKSNIQNIYIDSNDCWVELTFKADKDLYRIIRYYKPKSDLKIFVNEEDKSGKGIRESELQLASLLPDLTKELISGTILLGQGLPNKLSSLSPAGRKELLEKLSKSDFMIQDIKQRLENRETLLNSKVRESEDTLIKLNTSIELISKQIEDLDKYIEDLKNTNYDEELLTLSTKLSEIQKDINAITAINSDQESKSQELNDQLLTLTNKKQAELNAELTEYSAAYNAKNELYITLNNRVDQLKAEIKKLENIVDICPTCGQKIPNIIKPDTSKQKEELENVTADKDNSLKELENLKTKHQEYVKEINNLFEKDLTNVQTLITTLKQALASNKLNLTNLSNSKQELNNNYNKVLSSKETLLDNIKQSENKKITLNSDINKLTEQISEVTNTKNNLDEHLAVIKKMNTLIKRDFRGYLLTNVISYIDKKAKEYAIEVFGNSNIESKLDGNNIDIYFNNKICEALSGGERQKVDLLIQFAIRDMLEIYLDFRSNILVLDEITDALDPIGCTNIFNLISNKLTDIESIFIISHHADELTIPYDSELQIVKNENGISEIMH